MGSLYKNKYFDKNGNRRECANWWAQYYTHGKCIRENTNTADLAEAKQFLKRREGEATKGRITKSMHRKVAYLELASLVETDYELNGSRSVKTIKVYHSHVLPYFGKMRANQIDGIDIDRYVLKRKAEGAKNSSINRELSAIKRGYSLAVQKKIVSESDRPHISMLKEDNIRQGFFEPTQFQTLIVKLPDRLKPIARAAYITGWRKSEIIYLQWRQVDFAARYIRLEPGTTKNREARQFPFTDGLEVVLSEQRAKADALKKKGIITPWVFFYPIGSRAGRPIREFKRAWKTACREAGVPGRLLHDFRRTAVRNLVRAGVPERVAMKLTGHKTRSVFDRYNIVSEGDLREAAARLGEYLRKDEGNHRNNAAALPGSAAI
jgi:integrase